MLGLVLEGLAIIGLAVLLSALLVTPVVLLYERVRAWRAKR